METVPTPGNPPVIGKSPDSSSSADLIQKFVKRSTIALCVMSVGSQLWSDVSQSFLAYVVRQNTGYPFIVIGIMSAIYAIVSAVFFLLWGAVSDNLRTRFGRRIPLIFSGIVGTAILVIFFVTSNNLIWLIIDWGILIAVVNSMTKVTGSLTADIIPSEKRGRVNTLVQVLTPLGSTLIYLPSLVTLFGTSTLQETVIIAIDMVIYAGIGLIAFLLIKEPPVSEPPRRVINDIRKILSWRELTKNHDFLKLFFVGIFFAAADNAIFLNMFNFIESIFSTIEFNILILIVYGGLAAAIMIIGIYFLGRSIDRIGRKAVAITGYAFSPVGAFMIALGGNNLILLLLGFAIFTTFYWAGYSAVASWQQDILPKEARGRFFGILGIASAVGAAIGALTSTSIADRFGILWIFFAAAIFLWVSLPILSFVHETVHQKTRQTSVETPISSHSL